MIYLRAIVKQINDHLKNGALASERFQRKLFGGIAETVQELSADEKAFKEYPVEFDNDGEGKDLTINSDYDLIIYHKHERIKPGEDVRGSYGATNKTKNIAYMSMYVFGRRDMLRLSSDEAALIIQAGMPDTVHCEESQTGAATIKLTDIILNNKRVFNEEYKNVVYTLKPEHFLIRMDYTIENSFLKSCFNTCV